ncbi:hypothetical protein FB384_000785 [Prauserella sediminis]|uniref:Uncharacterized protein n=1 Tax=Prauserella sediminis TaxID=577680 RepID=A0A839XGJ7_9PSEU|nr:hypothetical protein [Prauserella sediminis]MBB3661881.1 hypothetical protein [Prauserella sediminis]
MNISRRDDRHNADLAKEISDSFNRAIGQRRTDDPETGENPDDTESAGAETQEQPSPQFVITGDRRDTGRKRRS